MNVTEQVHRMVCGLGKVGGLITHSGICAKELGGAASVTMDCDGVIAKELDRLILTADNSDKAAYLAFRSIVSGAIAYTQYVLERQGSSLMELAKGLDETKDGEVAEERVNGQDFDGPLRHLLDLYDAMSRERVGEVGTLDPQHQMVASRGPRIADAYKGLCSAMQGLPPERFRTMDRIIHAAHAVANYIYEQRTGESVTAAHMALDMQRAMEENDVEDSDAAP